MKKPVRTLMAILLCMNALFTCALAEEVPAAPSEEAAPDLMGDGGELVPPDSIARAPIGDLSGNGMLDAYDAALFLQALVGRRTMPFTAEADVYADGFVDALDAVYILEVSRHDAPGDIVVVYKPVIYLYPADTTDVTVTLGCADALTTVYPAYDGGWSVTAQPDGTLTDDSGRSYYSLYYEANVELPDTDGKGFVVPRAELSAFLEDTLARLGLTERETEEMIIYWLPLMQAYEYVRVHFASEADVERAMPLSVSPAPDTTIRVWMEWSGLDSPVEIEPQTLTASVREGFTVVEWGGIKR